ncbi:hypothetical protein ACFY41_23920 [Streptomyces syringium]|uniref:hypothetical protein n=1 Tax=Streptomyces syringium TaxID=76729 RepID=UPI0036CF4E1F
MVTADGAAVSPSRSSRLVRRTDLINSASGPDDWYLCLDWFGKIGASVEKALLAWGVGELALLPVGRAWDVVRLPAGDGWRAVTALSGRVPVGPVLHTGISVEVFVPIDSADGWTAPRVSVLKSGDLIGVPHPSFSSPRIQRAKSWVVAPSSGHALTSADDLRLAYAVTRVGTREEACLR